LSPSNPVVAGSYPLPTRQGLGGTVVQVKVGAATQTCIMYFTSATQVSGIVPSATPVATGTLTISYHGSSVAAPIQAAVHTEQRGHRSGPRSPILSMLPINGHGAQGVAGVGFQIAGVVDNRFTATGLDAGLFTVFTSTGPGVKVQ
jgi:hypothetical protein